MFYLLVPPPLSSSCLAPSLPPLLDSSSIYLAASCSSSVSLSSLLDSFSFPLLLILAQLPPPQLASSAISTPQFLQIQR
ncbi:hypothetical protein F2Q69_00033747 [Brassica cretica]|uniref:Uncharacterized protein n=1 Tax=Brassica cretica TaxID=69181 RepID=A0A8S9SEC5_BRACR|nr:hypothetical protein F2Q69_00033747 [Brassica cretica]